MKSLKFISLLLATLVLGVSIAQADRKKCNDRNLCGGQGPIRVGILPTDQLPPFTGIDENGQAFGFDVSLWCAFAQCTGVQIQFVEVPCFGAFFDALRNNQIDVIGISATGLTATRLVEFDALATNADQLTTQAFIFNPETVPADFPTDDPDAALEFVLAHPNPSDPEHVRIATLVPSFQLNSLVAQGYPASSIIETGGTSEEIAAGFCNNEFDVFFNDPSTLGGLQEGLTCDITLGLIDGIPLAPSQQSLGLGYLFRKDVCCQLLLTLQVCLNEIVANGLYQQFIDETANDPRFAEADRIGFAEGIVIPPANYSIATGIISAECVAQFFPFKCRTFPTRPQEPCNTEVVSVGLDCPDTTAAVAKPAPKQVTKKTLVAQPVELKTSKKADALAKKPVQKIAAVAAALQSVKKEEAPKAAITSVQDAVARLKQSAEAKKTETAKPVTLVKKEQAPKATVTAPAAKVIARPINRTGKPVTKVPTKKVIARPPQKMGVPSKVAQRPVQEVKKNVKKK